MICKNQTRDVVNRFGRAVAGVLFACHLCLVPGYALETRPQAADSSIPSKDEGDVMTRFRHIDDTLSRMEPVVRMIQERVPSLVGKVKELEDPALRDKLEKLMDEHKALEEKLDLLRRQLSELQRARESRRLQAPPSSCAELERAIAQMSEEKRALEKKLNDLQAQVSQGRNSDSKGCPVYEKFGATKRPKYVMIHSGRVVPIERPYYTFRQGYVRAGGRLVTAFEVKRAQEGEPVSQAINPGGCLDQLLSKLDTSKQYVSFQVCTDSIAAFRTAVEYVKSRKIPYTWEPEEDRTFVFTAPGSSGGDSPDIYGNNPE
jgi:hypothetical protein